MSHSPPNIDNLPEDLKADDQISKLKSVSLLLLAKIEILKNAQEGLEDKLKKGKLSNFAREVERFEAGIIRYALTISSDNQKKAAFLLGVKPTTLSAKIKRYKIDLMDFHE